MAATDKLHRESSPEAQARRATFNASASGKANLLGDGELVDAVSSGKVKLAEIPKPALPERPTSHGARRAGGLYRQNQKGT